MGETQALRPGLSPRRLLDAFLSVAFAPPCAACGEPLDRPTAGPVCLACWHAVVPLTAPLCDRCGMPLAGSSCASCARHPWLIGRARAAGAYAGSLREILHAFKYTGRPSLAAPIGTLMTESAGDLLSGIEAVVPVPLHRARHRERGFNQADLLARQLPVPIARLLVRTRATASQINLPADRRHHNVRGAFALNLRNSIGTNFSFRHPTTMAAWKKSKFVPIEFRTVLLVDDVVTTGATLNECARVLLDAGVREVRALTAARAL